VRRDCHPSAYYSPPISTITLLPIQFTRCAHSLSEKRRMGWHTLAGTNSCCRGRMPTSNGPYGKAPGRWRRRGGWSVAAGHNNSGSAKQHLCRRFGCEAARRKILWSYLSFSAEAAGAIHFPNGSYQTSSSARFSNCAASHQARFQ
jgi:hypothetical protein